MSIRDQALMQRAFSEAERASWLFTAPNPRVGALALKGGHVIGYGYHAAFGQAHAEEQALRDAGAWDQGTCTMRPGVVDEIIVTLEPCSSKGGAKKRPPCLEFLMQADVKRVVVGAVDPDPRHAGAAQKMLRKAGIEVEMLNLDEQFARMNSAFLKSLEHPERPWVLLKWAASVDGRTATPSGKSQWITGSASRQEVHQLRNLSHAVMAAKGTVQVDLPRLTARNENDQPNLDVARVLVAALHEFPVDHPLLADAGPRFWIESDFSAWEPPPWWTSLDHRIGVEADSNGRLDLSAALLKLRQDFGLQRVFVEGGSHLHASLLEGNLADAIVRYEAPLLLHGGLAACEGLGVEIPSAGIRLAHEERMDLGDDLRRAFLCTYST